VKAEQTASTLSTVLRPATGVRLFLSRGEGILFDEVGQKLFHLNSMATCIWCYIEETHSIESIIHSTAHSMHLDMDRAHHFVLKMIHACRRLGLLQGGRHRPGFRRRGLPLRRRTLRLTSTDESDSALQAQLHFYQLLDVKFSFAYGQRSLEALIHPILAHLELSRPPSEALRLEIDRTGEEWRVLHGSKVLGSCRDLQSLPPMVQGILSSVALRHHDFLLALHAGGIAWADKVMLLVGKSRSGKSTLTAALLGEGWDYLSDDMILIERESLDAKSMPCSLGIKPGGWELLASRFPRREPPRQHLRADGQSVGYLSPPPPRRGFLLPRTVQWIVFPSLSPAEPGNLQALSPLEGLQRLVTHCCGIPSALQPGDIRRLIEWSAGVSWFELKVGDLDTAVARLKKIALEHRIESD
jgi:hypothetical protein